MKVLIVFRKYDEWGFPIDGERVIERECDESQQQSTVEELKARGYEVEYSKRID